MILRINNQKREIELKEEITVNELLRSLNLRRESVVVLVNGEITIEEEKVRNEDEVQIVSAVSGG
jgi:thiamine biosynthesis protein ThiS